MKQLQFKVVVQIPESVTAKDAKEYVADAVSTMRGSLRPPGGYGDDDPGDPLFDLKLVSVSRL